MVYLVERFAPVAALMLALGMASAAPAYAICVWGFGQCESTNPIVGEYASEFNPSTMLTITPDKITSKDGPVSFSAGYMLKSVEGRNVTLELTEPKGTLRTEIEKDILKIHNSRFFTGD